MTTIICFTLLRILLAIALRKKKQDSIPMLLIPMDKCYHRAAILEIKMAATLLDMHFIRISGYSCPNLLYSHVTVDEGKVKLIKKTSYQSFASRLAKFKELHKVPLNVIPVQIDDGSGTTSLVGISTAKKVYQNQTVTIASSS